MNSIQKLLKNALSLIMSDGISKILAVIYFVFLARYLSLNDFGILSFAIALIGVIGIIGDFGLGSILVRDISRERRLTPRYLANTILIRIFLSIAVLILAICICVLSDYSTVETAVVLSISFNTIILNFVNVFYSMFQAYEKMELQSIGQMINSSTLFLIILFLIQIHADIIFISAAYAISSIFVLSYCIIASYIQFPDWFIWPDHKNLKYLVTESLPFGISNLFVAIYYGADSILLSYICGNEAVAVYNAAYKLVTISLFIPLWINVVLFPTMSSIYINSHDIFEYIFNRYFKYLALIAIPMAIVVTIMAPQIITAIYGSAYSESVLTLQILIWSSLFIFLGSAYVRALGASDGQSTVLKNTAICAFISVAINVLLIPSYGYIGSAITAVITQFISLIIYIKVSKVTHLVLTKNVSISILKITCASLFIGILASILSSYINIYITLIILVSIYIFLVILLKAFDNDDIDMIKAAFGKGTVRNNLKEN